MLSLAQLLALCGLAIAQPILSTFSADALEFVSRRATAVDVVAFALVVTLVPPLVLWVVGSMVAYASRRASAALHTGMLGALAALFVIQVLRTSGPPIWLVLAGSAIVGAGFGVAFRKSKLVREAVSYLAAAPVIFLAAFLFVSPVKSIIVPSPTRTATLESGGPRPTIVFVVFDEFPSIAVMDARGELDATRFPNLAELTRSGTWYREATTSSSWTRLAVPSILEGRYPDPAKAPVATDHPDSVFSLVASEYDLNVWEGPTKICSEDLCADPIPAPSHLEILGDLLGASRRVYLQRVAAESVDVELFARGVATSKPAPEIFRSFIDSIQPSGRPQLHFLHIQLPHQPWLALPSGAIYSAPDPLGRVDAVFTDEDAALAAHERYQLQVQATDRLIGELLARLRSTGVYDDAMVVLTADHGVSFDVGENQRAASPATFPEVAYPVLFVKYPHQRTGGTSDAPAQVIDIVPTIAKELDVDMPWAVDGVPLQTLDATAARERRYYPLWIDTIPVGPQGWTAIVDQPVAERIGSGKRPPPARGETWASYEVGQVRGLVGREVDQLAGQPAPAPRWKPLQPGLSVAYTPGRDRPPVFVDAELDAAPPGELAVSVNGVVGATGRPIRQPDGTVRFTMVVPEELLREGDNRFELHLVEPIDGADPSRGATLRQLSPQQPP